MLPKETRPPSLIVESIDPVGGYQGTPEQRAALLAALTELSFCRETMALVNSRLNGIPLLQALDAQDLTTR